MEKEKMSSFDIYKTLEKTSGKELKVDETKVYGLEEVLGLYKKGGYNILHKMNEDMEEVYSNMLEQVKNIKYSISDIEDFSKGLTHSAVHEFSDGVKKYQKYQAIWDFYKTGLFISALINNKAKDGDTINLNLSNVKIEDKFRDHAFYGLGYRMDKDINIVVKKKDEFCGIGDKMSHGKIIVYGNIYDAGSGMSGGEIIVYGNIPWVGCGMKGGKITVKGFGGYKDPDLKFGRLRKLKENKHLIRSVATVGKDMEGGEIIIEGKAGDYIGQKMKGGKIFLQDDFCSLYKKTYGGEIYIRGKRINLMQKLLLSISPRIQSMKK